MNRVTFSCIRHTIPIDGLHDFDLIGPAFEYRAGHYVHLLIEGKTIPFSIANAPNTHSYPSPTMTLRFIVRETSALSSWLRKLKTNTEVSVSGPMGHCVLPNVEAPLIFFAGGTGIAPINALLNEWLKHPQGPAVLYWGLRDIQESSVVLPQPWQGAPMLSAIIEEGLVHQHLKDLKPELLDKAYIFASGPYPMVSALHQELLSQNFPPDRFFSDLIRPTLKG